MKIIKHGTWNEPWSLEVTCPKCQAVLEVEEQDVKASFNIASKFECRCLDCASVIFLDHKLLHPRIVKNVEATRKWSSGGFKD